MHHLCNHRSCTRMLVLFWLVTMVVGEPLIAKAESSGSPALNGRASNARPQLSIYDTVTTMYPPSQNPTYVGHGVYIYASVADVYGDFLTDNTVAFKADGTIIPGCEARPLDFQYSAVCGYLPLSEGTVLLTAQYSGGYSSYCDCIYSPSTSDPMGLVVNADPSTQPSTATNILSVSPHVSVVGQPVVVFYDVAYSIGNIPTGRVTVRDGTDSCSGPAPTGSCTVTLTTAGSRTLTATYPGDTNFSGSSGTASHTVSRATTRATILSHDPNPSALGQDVVVHYAITVDPPGSGSPLGNATVSDGVVSCTGILPNSTCTLAPTMPGLRTLTLTYLGDGNFTGSTATTSHTVGGTNPVPTIAQISPNSITAASPGFTLTVTGTNFLSSSMVQWNGGVRATSYVSSTVLQAAIPGADVASIGVSHVTVVNPAPGGGPSNLQAFFTSALGTPITASGTISGTNPTATTGGLHPVTASATGTGTLTVALYGSNPAGTPSFASSGAYMDVHLAAGHTITDLTIEDCHLNGGTMVYWWTGSTWVPASDQVYNPSTQCVTIHVTGTTTPNLSDLVGTPFAAGFSAYRLNLPFIVR